MSIEVGHRAPDFELADQHGQPVRLADFQGRKNVLLVFYPLAFSGVCGGELRGIRDNIDAFQNDEVQLLTVSVDSMFSHRVWAEQEDLDYPLLSDFWPHGAVATAYGVFDEDKGVAVRATFLIDKEGVVRWKVVNPISEARDPEQYRKALAELS
ncbi:peroxiredoxin [Marinactinospora thermotolerans]|uniref:Alkyl hydroperoxide reductase E n=1 Tax=Marinactinospora thermotolerans DSM 45154 TaxID=1122192 RepID=A0A1T4S4A6_9ACTN|nr:peroxiredoxin [Marinactinospora thermotolerans]SKA23042.1 Peroxiredoxin [Marinactinospora thermotolerans DSM 45154]